MNRLKKNIRGLGFFAVATTLAATLLALYPTSTSQASNNNNNTGLFKRAVPSVDVNLTAAVTRLATAAQQQAINNFKATHGDQVTVRWNSFAGSPDVMMGFHTPPSSDTPENVGRAFVQANSALFGVDATSLVVSEQTEALGGYLVRFQQKAGDLNVAGGGIGLLMNRDKQIRMVMGSSFRDVNAAAAPAL